MCEHDGKYINEYTQNGYMTVKVYVCCNCNSKKEVTYGTGMTYMSTKVTEL